MAGGKIGDVYYKVTLDADGVPQLAKVAGDKAGKSFSKSFGGEISKGLKQGLGLGAGLGVAAGVAKGVSAIGDVFSSTITNAIAFEKAMANVNSIAKFTDAELADASAAVLKLSGDFGQSAQTMAEGLYDISSSGFKGADALTVLEAATKAATAGLATTGEAASGVTAVLNAYGLGAEEADRVSDILFETVNRGVISFPELASQIGKTTALSAPLGVALEEVAAATALMTRNGVGAEETFTQINAIMNAMLKPSVEAAVLAEELGLEWNAAGLRANGLVGTMQKLVKATGGSHEKMAVLLGDSRAIRGAFVLAQKSGAAFTEELGFMEDAAGATDKAFKIQSKSTAFAIAQMEAKIEAAGIMIGESFLPILAELAAFATDELVPALEDVATAIDGMDEGAQNNEDAFGNLSNVLHDLFKEPETDAKSFLGAVFDGMNDIMVLSKDINDAWTFWDTFESEADEAARQALELGIAANRSSRNLDRLDTSADTATASISDLGDGATDMGADVETGADKAKTAILELRDAIITAAKGTITRAYQIISDEAELSAANVETAELRKVIAVTGGTREQKDRYKELGETQALLIVSLAQNGQTASKNVNKAMNQIRERLKTATGQERKALLATLEMLKLLAAQANVTAAKVRAAYRPTNSRSGPTPMAHGGLATAGTPYIVGDGGRPELFVPEVNGTIIPQVPSDWQGSGGGTTYNVPVTVAGALPVRTIADIATGMRRIGDAGLLPSATASPQYRVRR